eukprot:g63102.t1
MCSVSSFYSLVSSPRTVDIRKPRNLDLNTSTDLWSWHKSIARPAQSMPLSLPIGTCRPVICVETGKVYQSIKEAAKAVDRQPQAVWQSLKNGHKSGGYRWCYLDDDEVWVPPEVR